MFGVVTVIMLAIVAKETEAYWTYNTGRGMVYGLGVIPFSSFRSSFSVTGTDFTNKKLYKSDLQQLYRFNPLIHETINKC